MPREDETYRAARYGGHPPYCTCVECVRRRRERQLKGGGLNINWRAVIYALVALAAVAALILLLVSGS